MLPRAHDWLGAVIRRTFVEGSALRVLVWQPATSLYAVLTLGVIACLRMRTMAPLLVLLLPLTNAALWLVVATGQELRFLFSIVFAAPLALCIVAGNPSQWRGGGAGASSRGSHQGGPGYAKEPVPHALQPSSPSQVSSSCEGADRRRALNLVQLEELGFCQRSG